MIESPKSLMTAATIASQISLQISNGQHGGQTITLSHLAPYVRVSREKIYKNEKKHHPNASEEEILKAVEDNLHQEIIRKIRSLPQMVRHRSFLFSFISVKTKSMRKRLQCLLRKY